MRLSRKIKSIFASIFAVALMMGVFFLVIVYLVLFQSGGQEAENVEDIPSEKIVQQEEGDKREKVKEPDAEKEAMQEENDLRDIDALINSIATEDLSDEWAASNYQ